MPPLPIRLVSAMFKPEFLQKILDVSRPCTAEGHFVYPADEEVDVFVYPRASCPECTATNQSPVSWKEFADGPRR